MGAEHERHQELLAEEILFGLDAAESGEMKESGSDPSESLVLELTAAAMLRHLVEREGIQTPPAGLQSRLSSDAFRWLSQEGRKPRLAGADRNGLRGGGAPMHAVPTIAQPANEGFRLLVLAAAVLLVTTLALRSLWSDGPEPAAQRQSLLAAVAEDDVLMLPWAEGSDAPGDVVWSQAKQEGYLTFDGLPVNDPTDYQYQLWIFDADVPADQKDENGIPLYPVDGGVFDIDSDGRVVVPIDAKLEVRQPVAFAVTRERPGGVVRSTRTDIATITPL